MTGTIVGARTWTEDRVRSLGMTTDIETAGEILGIGRTKAYALAKAGAFPARIIRVGRLYKVSVPALLSLFGIGPGGIAKRSAPESLAEPGASSPARVG